MTRSAVERRIAIGSAAASALVVLVLGRRGQADWLPTTDWALIELRVRDLTGALPSVGMPSANGFAHPGPLPYLALAPVYFLAGATPQALVLAAAVLAAGSVLGAAWTAWRRGGLVLVAVVLAALVAVAGSGSAGFLLDPWNPWIAVLPFAWFLLLAWSVVEGDAVSVPLAALVGSFVVQAHVGYLPIVGLVTVVALVGLGWRLRRDRSAALVRGLVVAAGVTALVWAAPLVEQVRGDPGNVTRTASEFTRADRGASLGVGGAIGVLATEWGGVPPWLDGDEPVDAIASTVLPGAPAWLALPLAAGAAAAWFGRRDGPGLRFLGVVGTAALGTVAAVSRIETGRAFPYIVRGTWVVGAMGAVAVVWVLTRAAERAWAGATRVVTAAALVLLVVGGVRLVRSDGPGVPIYRTGDHRTEQACVEQLLPTLRADAGSGPVHLTTSEFWPVFAAPIANELDRAGVDVSVSGRLAEVTDRPDRQARPGEVAYVVAEGSGPAGATVVARCDGLTTEERTRVDAVAARRAAGEATTPAEVADLFALAGRNVQVVVTRDG